MGQLLVVNVRDLTRHCEGSDIISLNLLGTPLIGLNSAESIKDLLEKRSSIYSDRSAVPVSILSANTHGFPRPKSVMLHEL